MFKTLSKVAKELNEAKIQWAVGASIMLNQFGLVDKPNDIDLLISVKDIKRADEILKELGIKKEYKNTDTYTTKFFYEYVIDGVDIDVMAGLAIRHEAGVFEYVFDELAISDKRIIENEEVAFTSLEDWFVLYQLIPKREYKVQLIKEYLLERGIENSELLKRSLEGELPVRVKVEIRELLGGK